MRSVIIAAAAVAALACWFVVRQRDAAHRAEHHLPDHRRAATSCRRRSPRSCRSACRASRCARCSAPVAGRHVPRRPLGLPLLLQARLDGSRPAARSRRDVLGRSPGELDGGGQPAFGTRPAGRYRRRPWRQEGEGGRSGAKAAEAAAAAASAAQAAASAPAPDARQPVHRAGVRCGGRGMRTQAARAANRATNQVSGQGSGSRRFTPAAKASAGAPVPGGQPPGAAPAIQPQFQFHRPPQPNASNEAAPPVGPQGSDNLQNQPLTAPAQ